MVSEVQLSGHGSALVIEQGEDLIVGSSWSVAGGWKTPL